MKLRVTAALAAALMVAFAAGPALAADITDRSQTVTTDAATVSQTAAGSGVLSHGAASIPAPADISAIAAASPTAADTETAAASMAPSPAPAGITLPIDESGDGPPVELVAVGAVAALALAGAWFFLRRQRSS